MVYIASCIAFMHPAFVFGCVKLRKRLVMDLSEEMCF